ncbi:MAG: phosphocholine cytidylyltransferase family protein [Candidatus Eremiobacterota bacterium]
MNRTRAVILAAGQGTRLRPLTDDRPKCLVELAGVPLLDRQLHALKTAGLQPPLVVGGYRADRLVDRGHRVIVNPLHETTNMVYSLFCAAELFDGQQDVLVSYGDIVCEPRVVQAVLACPDPVGVVVDLGWRDYWEIRSDDPLQDAETLRQEPDGRLVELGKRPRNLDEIQAQYIGLFKVRADWASRFLEVYRGLDPKAQYEGRSPHQMFMTSFLQHLIDTNWLVRAVSVRHGWLEVDTVDDLSLYHRMLEDGSLTRFYAAVDSPPGS